MAEADYAWVEEMKKKIKAGDKNDPHIRELNSIEEEGEKPMEAIHFDRTDRDFYIGEVAKKEDDLIYHFFPKGQWPGNFEDKMGDAFLEVFRFPEKLEAAFTEELDSWAVKVIGYAKNLSVDILSVRVFDVLDEKLKS